MGKESLAGPPQDKHQWLPGQPGYRTRPSRSGLDPIDTALETSHMEGVFLSRLFSGRLITRQPLYLLLMLAIGIPLLIPLALSIAQYAYAKKMIYLELNPAPLLLTLFMSLLGIPLLVNFSINLLLIMGILPRKRSKRTRRSGGRKSWYPQGRKDRK